MMATISPALVAELQKAHESAGIGYVSAPVLGIPLVAAKGELNIMVAGNSKAVLPCSHYSMSWARKLGLLVKIPNTQTLQRLR